MALSQKLLEIIACPKCKGSLELQQDQSAFICRSCPIGLPDRRRYSDNVDRRGDAAGKLALGFIHPFPGAGYPGPLPANIANRSRIERACEFGSVG